MHDPQILYAHGFGSGPRSSKGRAVEAHLRGRGLSVDLLDLRVPTPNELRLSRMIEVVRDAIRAPRVLAIGSSLGGLTVARAAERDPRIVATVLLAPAFQLAARWRRRMGEAEWQRWKDEGRYTYDDYTTPGGKLRVDFGFMEDAEEVDVGFPDVRVPTTVVHGRNDATIDPELSRTFAASRPNVRLVETDDDHQLLRSLDVITRAIDETLATL